MVPPEDDRTYIRLHDGMPEHPKVEGLSDRAFRLLVASWCWCSRYQTDGWITKSSWSRRGSAAARRELLDAGLVEPTGSHVYLHDYLVHQRSAAEIAELKATKRAGGQRGNHVRWHLSRGRVDPDCELCAQESQHRSEKPSEKRSHTESHTASHSDRKTSPDTDTDTEIPREIGEGASGTYRASDTSPRCSAHQHTPGDPGPCRGCAAARTAAEDAERRRRRDATLAKSRQARAEARTRQLAAAACSLCDDDGRTPAGQLCRHDPDAPARARRGRAKVDAALKRQAPP